MHTRMTIWNLDLIWSKAAKLALLIVCALLITNLGLPQGISGPAVNALLILSVGWVGVSGAILIGMVTPLGAALHGVLPLPLAVMIPFIALGNAAFVSIYGVLRETHRPLALGLGAVAKFALLYGAVEVLVARPLSLVFTGAPQVVLIPEGISNMMRWPQLATALAGGLIALGLTTLNQHRRAR
jgi:hypothetical protein